MISQHTKHKGFILIHGNSLIPAYPGAAGNTEAYGANNAGDVVGVYVDATVGG